VGTLTVVSLFAALAFVGFAVALNAPRSVRHVARARITIWLVGQAFINIGVAVGLLPVTGLPLPFFVVRWIVAVVTLAACGMLMSVARHTRGVIVAVFAMISGVTAGHVCGLAVAEALAERGHPDRSDPLWERARWSNAPCAAPVSR